MHKQIKFSETMYHNGPKEYLRVDGIFCQSQLWPLTSCFWHLGLQGIRSVNWRSACQQILLCVSAGLTDSTDGLVNLITSKEIPIQCGLYCRAPMPLTSFFTALNSVLRQVTHGDLGLPVTVIWILHYNVVICRTDDIASLDNKWEEAIIRSY